MLKPLGLLVILAGTLALPPVAARAQDAATDVIEKQYEDGGVYRGTFRGGRQHGQGTYTLPNGYEYSGEWVDGEIMGQGTARFPSGAVYEGAFARGKPEGFGRIVYPDGSTYEGDWTDGRISGVGRTTSRVVLLTDTASRVPVTIQPSGQRAILTSDTGPLPLLEFIERPEDVRPGDRVVSSGDGGLFPAGVLVGQVASGTDRRPRVALAADYARLDFLRVLRSHQAEPIRDPGALIPPPAMAAGVIGPPVAEAPGSDVPTAGASPGAGDG